MNDTRADGPVEVFNRYLDAFNEGRLDDALALVAEDAVDHSPLAGSPPGREGWRQKWANMFEAFPDSRFDMEQQFASSDEVVSGVYRLSATHAGDLDGAPATGRRFERTSIVIARVRDGQIVEEWATSDRDQLLSQIGSEGLDVAGGNP